MAAERGDLFLKRLLLRGFFVALLLIIFAGCGTKEAVREVSDAEVVRERATAYWDSVIRGDFVKAYEFEFPLYRKQVPAGSYVRQYSNPRIEYRGFEVKEVSLVDETTADVSVKTNRALKVPGAKPFVTDVLTVDRWVKLDGIWFHVVDRAKERITHQEGEK